MMGWLRRNPYIFVGALWLFSGCLNMGCSAGVSDPVGLSAANINADGPICESAENINEITVSGSARLDYADSGLVILSQYFGEGSAAQLQGAFDSRCQLVGIERITRFSETHDQTNHLFANKKDVSRPSLTFEQRNLLQTNESVVLEYDKPGYAVISWGLGVNGIAVLDILDQAGIRGPSYRVIELGPSGRRLLIVL